MYVSFLVPVYNVEKYLEKCADSQHQDENIPVAMTQSSFLLGSSFQG